MASLTAHLIESGDHGRLGFHPNCPACRQQRLFGSLSSDAVISRRAQAALASGVLALSAVGPPAALAQESDHQVEGGSGPGPEAGTGETSTGPVSGPSSEPEAETTPPSAIVAPAAPEAGPVEPPDDPADSDLAEVVPVEVEPVEAPTSPSVPRSGAESEIPSDVTEPDVPDPQTGPEGDDPESSVEAPGPPKPLAQENTTAEVPDPSQPVPPAPGGLRSGQSAETVPRDHTASPPSITQTRSTSIVSAPESTTAPPAADPASISSSSDPAPKAGAPSPAGKRVIVVQPGDSLWSIAKRLLGPDASPAQIARKVSRLWALNADRIGTGRPDLLLVGTELRLR